MLVIPKVLLVAKAVGLATGIAFGAVTAVGVVTLGAAGCWLNDTGTVLGNCSMVLLVPVEDAEVLVPPAVPLAVAEEVGFKNSFDA